MTEQSEIGPTPELAWLPVDRLEVDHRYQRTLETSRSKGLINRIAEQFRWAAFQAILATPKSADAAEEDRRWLILDGQHRTEAARRRGITHVPAVVVSAESVEDQAAAFVRANCDRVTVNAFSLHQAKLVAGDPHAEATSRVLAQCGISFPSYSMSWNDLRPGQTLAVGMIGQLVKTLGEATAAAILGTVATAYRDQPGMLRAQILRAVMRLYQDAAEQARTELLAQVAEYLAMIPAARLISRALTRKDQFGGPEYENIAALIRDGIEAISKRDRRMAPAVPPPLGKLATPAAKEAAPIAPETAPELAIPAEAGITPDVRTEAPARPVLIAKAGRQLSPAEQERTEIEAHIAAKGVSRPADGTILDRANRKLRADGHVVTRSATVAGRYQIDSRPAALAVDALCRMAGLRFEHGRDDIVETPSFDEARGFLLANDVPVGGGGRFDITLKGRSATADDVIKAAMHLDRQLIKAGRIPNRGQGAAKAVAG